MSARLVRDGAFQVGDLPPGRTFVAARANGFAPHFVLTRMEAGRRRDIRIRLFLEAAVEGHVFDSNGSPVEGASLILDYRESTPGRGVLASMVGGTTITGPDGAFALNGLVPSVQLGLRAEIDGRRSEIENVSIGPGMVRQNIVLRLP